MFNVESHNREGTTTKDCGTNLPAHPNLVVFVLVTREELAPIEAGVGPIGS